jgi:NAD(P)-dependent dehydrogenase (short-subunit alcohol dehydrogenase family)
MTLFRFPQPACDWVRTDGAAKAAIAHYTRYNLAQDLGPFGITANRITPGVIATGRIMQAVIPGSSQSNRDRAELVALRRLGTVEDAPGWSSS